TIWPLCRRPCFSRASLFSEVTNVSAMTVPFWASSVCGSTVSSYTIRTDELRACAASPVRAVALRALTRGECLRTLTIIGRVATPLDTEPNNSSGRGGPMCVHNDSRPPITPIAGGSAGSRDLRLASADGTRFMAYEARAKTPTGAGMIVIPDVRGLHPYYKELADRFAEIGVDAVAIDFFARTAPSDDRGEKFDFMSHVPQTKPETLQ